MQLRGTVFAPYLFSKTIIQVSVSLPAVSFENISMASPTVNCSWFCTVHPSYYAIYSSRVVCFYVFPSPSSFVGSTGSSRARHTPSTSILRFKAIPYLSLGIFPFPKARPLECIKHWWTAVTNTAFGEDVSHCFRLRKQPIGWQRLSRSIHCRFVDSTL